MDMKLDAIFLMLILTAIALPNALYAADGRGHRTLDDTVAAMRLRGRVLSAEEQEREGRPVHAIRLLTPEGKVKRIYVDPVQRRRGPSDR